MRTCHTTGGSDSCFRLWSRARSALPAHAHTHRVRSSTPTPTSSPNPTKSRRLDDLGVQAAGGAAVGVGDVDVVGADLGWGGGEGGVALVRGDSRVDPLCRRDRRDRHPGAGGLIGPSARDSAAVLNAHHRLRCLAEDSGAVVGGDSHSVAALVAGSERGGLDRVAAGLEEPAHDAAVETGARVVAVGEPGAGPIRGAPVEQQHIGVDAVRAAAGVGHLDGDPSRGGHRERVTARIEHPAVPRARMTHRPASCR